MIRFRFTYLVFLLFILPASSWGQHAEPTSIATLFDHWYTGDTSTIEIKITTDIRQLFKNPSKEEYQEADFKVVLGKGEEESYTGKVRLRGNIRRRICQIPPIKIKFKKKEMAARGWLPHNDLKLVVPCQDNFSAEQNVVAEFLTYRMYEKISPISLRVQMVRIHMVDSEEKRKDKHMLAFIIEPIETLAARFNLREANRTTYREAFLEETLYRETAFYQYMIGNTDWNVYNGHNLYFIGGSPYSRLVSVPYDFDYSAVVGTSYAVPHESLPIESVTQRLYRGLSCEEEEALALVNTFADKKETLLQPILDNHLLTEGKRKEMLRYLEGFFKTLEKTKGIVWELKK